MEDYKRIAMKRHMISFLFCLGFINGVYAEENYTTMEDSCYQEITVIPVISVDSAEFAQEQKKNQQIPKQAAVNDYVPKTLTIDKTKAVGSISINSAVSPTGAKTYQVPFDLPEGINNFQPEISLYYNSMQTDSELGTGWSMRGISKITRISKSIYYDGATNAISMAKDDALSLDGNRLIKKSGTSSEILYESEKGNIIVKGHLSGDTLCYFDVFYPDGKKAVFGTESNSQNYYEYPQTKLVDTCNNPIIFTYVNDGTERFLISTISYNNTVVNFSYKNRDKSLSRFIAGNEINEKHLLEKVVCKYAGVERWTYTLSYITNQNNTVLLDKIDFSSNGENLNPLRFFYGKGNVASSFDKSDIQLSRYLDFSKPAEVNVYQGKFDYDNGCEGVLVYANRDPYSNLYKSPSTNNHTINYFVNQYDSDCDSDNASILFYAGINQSFESFLPNLKTEKGFIDIFCADLKGQQEENIIKVNNYIDPTLNTDHLVFSVYGKYAISGYAKYYERVFDFNTVLQDKSGNKSIQPKFYYTGDFDGDGRMEVFAISTHKVVDQSDVSCCYLFDLENNKILFNKYVFPFIKKFPNSETSAQDAANNSDKIFAIDFDGDGKTDIVRMTSISLEYYSFEVVGGVWNLKKVASTTTVSRASFQNSHILLGDFNGDGLIDFLKSPSSGTSSTEWKVFYSKGNGLFKTKTFNGPRNEENEYGDFLAQDINGDGKTDLLYILGGSVIRVYFASDDSFNSNYFQSNTAGRGSAFVPVNINSRNTAIQLASIYKGKLSKYSFSRDDSESAMMTGMANSFGIIEQNEYRKMDDTSSSFYSIGEDAVFPYVNLQEPLSLLASTSLYKNGEKIDWNTYNYENAVLHRQGLGFRGFASFTTRDRNNRMTVQSFDTYNYSVPKKETTVQSEQQYSFNVLVNEDKTVKILLSSKTEKDLLKGITATTSYVYDDYGFPITESTTFSDGISVVNSNIYHHRADISKEYILGDLYDRTTTTRRNNTVYSERRFIPAGTSQYPNVIQTLKDGYIVEEKVFSYDSKGNVTSSNVKAFTGVSKKTIYGYDSYNRVTSLTEPTGLVTLFTHDNLGRQKSKTDPRGGITTYNYDSFGRDTLQVYPDGTKKRILYAWSSETPEAVYSVTTSETGKPSEKTIYDAYDRPIRFCQTCFDGSVKKTDRMYDADGNILKVSLPYKGTEPSLWNTYEYDFYGRLKALVQASGKEKRISYSATKVTTTFENISTTKNYDSQGVLISSTDPSGTVTFNLAADGQPKSISTPSGLSVTFVYDKYRRKVSMQDPAHGTITYSYDNGGNISKETNANGKAISKQYDSFDRITVSAAPEFTTTFTYDAYGELLKSESTNGTSKSFVYDVYGRVSSVLEKAPDNVWLKKEYTYSDGNIKSIRYTSQSGLDVLEEYTYANGCLTQRTANGENIFTLQSENEFGLPTVVKTGIVTRTYNYDEFGYPSQRSSYNPNKGFYSICNYGFDYETSNLTWRKNVMSNYTESFEYDELNRLVSYNGSTAEYDKKGNILSKSDVGTFTYSLQKNPYAITGADFLDDSDDETAQYIHYTSFSRPDTISEGKYKVVYTYNSDYDRVSMRRTEVRNSPLTRFYLGNCYELDRHHREIPINSGSQQAPVLDLQRYTITEKLYLGGDYYHASIVYVKEDSPTNSHCYNVIRNYLGSITHVIDTAGVVKQHVEYDPWGRLRNPQTFQLYAKNEEPELFFGRGYTGHEHLPQFHLINMNARLYDPMVGRFLSPDTYVQMPELPQNYNRYSYALNNPLKYNDPDGDFFIFTLLNAIFDFGTNLVKHGLNFGHYRWNKTVNAFKIDMGMFKGNIWQVLNKWTFGAVNSYYGIIAAHAYNLFGKVNDVTYMDGMVALDGPMGDSGKACTIAQYSLGPNGYKADWRDHLFVHEYGHYMQSQVFGPAFLTIVAIPSLLSAMGTSKLSGITHDDRWFERDANRRAAKHFDKKYGPNSKDQKYDKPFNKEAFINGGEPGYANPRTGKTFYKNGYPVSGSTIVWWDLFL